ncbi:hypothetical protein HYS47_04180 [Candidatus Woesearchaeota archaeon]|nr:hypothetical protein [Candidatus Woesearchaeota archaeon]
MERSITKKLVNGKLVRLFVEAQDTVTSIKITGDFFCHPEEAIEDMEKILLDTTIPISVAAVQQKLDIFVAANKVMLVGITTEAIATMMKEALQ